MRYYERQMIREAARSPQAAAVASFLHCHTARRIVAKVMSDLGQISIYNGRWPKDAHGDAWVTWLDGSPSWNVTAGSAHFRLEPWSPGWDNGGGFKHRLFVKCPDCGEWVPTGRFHQHAGSARCRRGTR